MPTTFRAYHPDQILLLAPDLREWVPEGHLSHQVSDLVDSLDLGSFYAPYEGDGRRNAPYEPSMMLKVLIYGYATGVYSSRAIARKLEEDLATLEERGIDGYVALGREGKERVDVDSETLPATHRMGEKLASPEGRGLYAKRKWLSEAPNGWIKEMQRGGLGFRRFSFRGLEKVRAEWDLVCLALNAKRMAALTMC